MKVTAVKQSNQARVNKVLRLEAKYNNLVDHGKEDTRQGDKLYDNLVKAYADLPKSEIDNINKVIK